MINQENKDSFARETEACEIERRFPSRVRGETPILFVKKVQLANVGENTNWDAFGKWETLRMNPTGKCFGNSFAIRAIRSIF